MAAKASGRRRFLRESAALVGGLAVGGMGPAIGQEAPAEPDVFTTTTARPIGRRGRGRPKRLPARPG